MLMTKKKFDALLKKHGAIIDAEMLSADVLQVDAPKGKVFTGNGCHTIVVQYRNYVGQSWIQEARAELAVTLDYGTENCEREDCDICQNI